MAPAAYASLWRAFFLLLAFLQSSVKRGGLLTAFSRLEPAARSHRILPPWGVLPHCTLRLAFRDISWALAELKKMRGDFCVACSSGAFVRSRFGLSLLATLTQC